MTAADVSQFKLQVSQVQYQGLAVTEVQPAVRAYQPGLIVNPGGECLAPLGQAVCSFLRTEVILSVSVAQ